MGKKKNRNYFYSVFFTFLFAISFFLILKHHLPDRLFPENTTQNLNIVIDSMALKAMSENMEPDSILTVNSNSSDTIENRTDTISYSYAFDASKSMEGYRYLEKFFSKLYQLESEEGTNNKVRIAYYSDSMTDGDLIVQDIRKLYQDKYGGKGVGFVGITSPSAASRYTVSHRYSKDWKIKSLLNNSKLKELLGIDGQTAFAGKHTYNLELRSNNFPNVENLNRPVLFYGRNNNQHAEVFVYADKDSVRKEKIEGDNLLNTIVLTSENPKRLKLEFHKADSIPFYGVNLDNGKGVHIDNFSLRGNSGLPLSLLNINLMRKFNDVLHYDLIILHFGTNVLNYGTVDYTWYEQKMAQVTRHLKECFPTADILVISIADKATKVEMEMKTDRAVEPLIKAQRNYAEKTGAGFINLYHLMGGNGSMVKWVEKDPVLANKDYTHFNSSGSKKVAKLIFDEIEKGYKIYKGYTEETESDDFQHDNSSVIIQ